MENKETVMFGAGKIGRREIKRLNERVSLFLDNDTKLHGKKIDGIMVKRPEDIGGKLADCRIILSVSEKYIREIKSQLETLGAKNFITWEEAEKEELLERINSRPDMIGIYKKSLDWIKTHIAEEGGIICNTRLPIGYPEVTGYYIPSLLRWGHRDIAISFARWLCGIQKEDGSWYDAKDSRSYIFDTGQILKGLIAVRKIFPDADSHIRRGCDWLLSNMDEDGRLHQEGYEWEDIEGWSSELIHLYCLSPIMDAADIFSEVTYRERATMIKQYYLDNYMGDIMSFTLLSHFQAYVMEALLDLRETDVARKAMERIADYQTEDGAVPGLKDVEWICSTGLFQLALVWFRLGDIKRGNAAFSYACKLQNPSGGWYGSYSVECTEKAKNAYAPDVEISWASKYFLDALYYKNLAEFENQADIFKNTLSYTDGRYTYVEEAIRNAMRDSNCRDGFSVADIGCGKGAYLKNLYRRMPEVRYCAVDLSARVMGFIDIDEIEKRQGSLTSIPYGDDEFDFAYACESLEHAIDIESAIREMTRVTKAGGTIVIIDKNKDALGRMEIEDWEQWFDVDELRGLMEKYCTEVTIEANIAYENPADGLFCAWKGKVR